MNGLPSDELHLETTAALALGALSAREASAARAHLLTCVACQREYADLRPIANSVGVVATADVPPAANARMKSRLMDAVRADVAGRPPAFVAPLPTEASNVVPFARPQKRSFAWVAYVAAAAGFVFALTSTTQNVGLQSKLAETQKREADLTAQVASVNRAAALARTTLADVSAPDAKHFDVPNGTVIVRGSHVYLSLEKLPALPRGKVYEAWTLANGATAVKRSVLFAPAVKNTLVALPEDARNLVAVAVSIEPEGGSAKPTTTPNFIRKLG